MKEIIPLLGFMQENHNQGHLILQQVNEIEKLVEKYRLPRLVKDTTVITAELGSIIGNIVIREILSCEEKDLSYSSGNYDYVDTATKSNQIILWTDYSNEQPYNRHGCSYVGYSFETLGEPVVKAKKYREFNKKFDYQSNICFPIWGFKYNKFYGHVAFGICLENKNVEEFVYQLRVILNK